MAGMDLSPWQPDLCRSSGRDVDGGRIPSAGNRYRDLCRSSTSSTPPYTPGHVLSPCGASCLYVPCYYQLLHGRNPDFRAAHEYCMRSHSGILSVRPCGSCRTGEESIGVRRRLRTVHSGFLGTLTYRLVLFRKGVDHLPCTHCGHNVCAQTFFGRGKWTEK